MTISTLLHKEEIRLSLFPRAKRAIIDVKLCRFITSFAVYTLLYSQSSWWLIPPFGLLYVRFLTRYNYKTIEEVNFVYTGYSPSSEYRGLFFIEFITSNFVDSSNSLRFITAWIILPNNSFSILPAATCQIYASIYGKKWNPAHPRLFLIRKWKRENQIVPIE